MELYLRLQELASGGLVFAIICLWVLITYANRSKNKNRTPPEPAGAWPIIGHLHLLGANKLFHHTLGEMADKYGPAFCIKLGVRRTLVVSSWEVAKECFTTNDKVFSTRPRSLAVKLMGYDHLMFGFSPYGPYWRDVRKLAITELLSNSRLEMLKHVRDSEINFFIQELYEQWVGNGGRSQHLVEMKQRFGDLGMNIVEMMVSGKRHFGSIIEASNEESRQCQKAMRDFMHLVGLFMVSDAVPFLGWVDVVMGYNRKMKQTAKEIDRVLGSWVEEHQQRRLSGSIIEEEKDFIDVILSVSDGGRLLSAQDANTVAKATCLSLT